MRISIATFGSPSAAARATSAWVCSKETNQSMRFLHSSRQDIYNKPLYVEQFWPLTITYDLQFELVFSCNMILLASSRAVDTITKSSSKPLIIHTALANHTWYWGQSGLCNSFLSNLVLVDLFDTKNIVKQCTS
jgi:hypothetical protein